LKIETSEKNEKDLKDELNKAIDWLNREIYKKEVERLKNNLWDNEVLKEYTQLITKAKKYGIK
jgi:hypothetical protein